MAKLTAVLLAVCILRSIGASDDQLESIPRIAVEPRSRVVWKSQRVTLQCLAGNGTVTIDHEWFHDRKPVNVTGGRQTLEKNGSLVIVSFDERDTGDYYCLVRFVINGQSQRVFAMRSRAAKLEKYSPFELIHPPRNTTAYVNNAAYFDCYPDTHIPVTVLLNALNKAPYRNGSLLWWRNGNPVQDKSGTSEYLPNGGLLVKSVSQRQDTEDADVERYCCIIIGLPQQVCGSLTILPFDGNRAPNLTVEPYNLTVSVGETVVVPCVASGVPRPEVEWYKEGEEEVVSNGQNVIASDVLIITNTTVGDSGIYCCVVKNSEGMVDRNISVIVLDGPRVVFMSKDYQVHHGYQARLVCPVVKTNYPSSVVNDIPHLNVTWLLNGIPIDPTDHKQMVLPKYKLIISSVDTSDDGMYQCLVENQHGSIQTSFLLETYGPPTKPGKLSLHLTPGNGILTWRHSDPNCQIAGCQITGYNVTANLYCTVTGHRFTLQTFPITSAILFDTKDRQGIFHSPDHLNGNGAKYRVSVTANNLFGESTRRTGIIYVGRPIKIGVLREPQSVRISIPLPNDILDSDITPSMCQIDSKLCNGEDGRELLCSFCVNSTNLEPHSPSLGVSVVRCDDCTFTDTHIVANVTKLQWNTVYQFFVVLQLAPVGGLKKTTSLPVNCSTGMAAPTQRPEIQQAVRINSRSFYIKYKGIDLDSVRNHAFYYQLNIHSENGKLVAQLRLPSDHRNSNNVSIFHFTVNGTAHGLKPQVNYELTLQSCCDNTTCRQWASTAQCGTMTLAKLETVCYQTCNCTSPTLPALIGSPPTQPGKLSLRLDIIPGNGILTWQASNLNCQITGCQITGYNVTVNLYYNTFTKYTSQIFPTASAILFATKGRQGIFRSPDILKDNGARYGFAVTAKNSFGESTPREDNFYVGRPIKIDVLREPQSVRISFPLPYDILDSDIKPSMCQIEPKLCSGGDGSGICSFCVKSTNLESPSLAVSVVRCDDCPLTNTHVVASVTRLQWNSIYQFFAMLQLAYGGVKTTASLPVNCSTGMAAPTQRPEFQQAVRINSKSFYIKYKGIDLDSVRSHAFYYQLDVYSENGKPVAQLRLPSDHRNNTNVSIFHSIHTVHGLKPQVNYELALQSCCDNTTCRQWASTAQCGTMTLAELETVCYQTCNCTNFTLPASIQPQNISFEALTVDSQWVFINGTPIFDPLVIGYMINVSSQSSYHDETVKQLPANLSGLQPQTTYAAVVSVLTYDKLYPAQPFTFTTLGLDGTPSQEIATVYHTEEATSGYNIPTASTTISTKHSSSLVLILSTLLGLVTAVAVTACILCYFCKTKWTWTRMRFCQSRVSIPESVGPNFHTYENETSSSGSDHDYEDISDDAMQHHQVASSEEEAQFQAEARIRNNRNWNYQGCRLSVERSSDSNTSQNGGTRSDVNYHIREEIGMSDFNCDHNATEVESGESIHTTTVIDEAEKVPGTPDSSQMYTGWEDNACLQQAIYLRLPGRQEDQWSGVVDVSNDSHPLQEQHPHVAPHVTSTSSLGQISDGEECELLRQLRKFGFAWGSGCELDSEGEVTAVGATENVARSPDYTDIQNSSLNEGPCVAHGAISNRYARWSPSAVVVSPLVSMPNSEWSAGLCVQMEGTSDAEARPTISLEHEEATESESESDDDNDFVDLSQLRTTHNYGDVEARTTISSEYEEDTELKSDIHESRPDVVTNPDQTYRVNWCHQSAQSRNSEEGSEDDSQMDCQSMSSFLSSIHLSDQLECDDSSEAGTEKLQTVATFVNQFTNNMYSTRQSEDRHYGTLNSLSQSSACYRPSIALGNWQTTNQSCLGETTSLDIASDTAVNSDYAAPDQLSQPSSSRTENSVEEAAETDSNVRASNSAELTDLIAHRLSAADSSTEKTPVWGTFVDQD